MGRSLLRRAGYALLLMWLVVSLTFVLLELAPGDASLHFLDPVLPAGHADLLREQWGLNQPAHLRYLLLLRNLGSGQLGDSLVHARPVVPDTYHRLRLRGRYLTYTDHTSIQRPLRHRVGYPVSVQVGHLRLLELNRHNGVSHLRRQLVVSLY